MIIMSGLGATLGAALFALVWFLTPHPPSILAQLNRFDTRPSSRPEPGNRPAGLAGLFDRLGTLITRRLASYGITYPSLRADLMLTGGTLETLLALKALAFVSGLLAALSIIVILHATLGITLPFASPALLSAGAGVGVFFAPDLYLHQRARTARRQFRRALSSWLDLVALEMAGSAAPAEALPAATRLSSAWPMLVLGDTLYRATAARQDHWEALTDLGYRIGISELIDLADLTRLVGRDGARVRDTLTARAAAMRRALLAEAEAQAGQQDQSMLIAQILIGLGFIIFIMYPALMNVMA